MGAYDCWCAQKPKLREKIKDCTDAGSIAYAVRHALAQVEQTTMAEQTDDLLRQQLGILFSGAKTSAQLLDVSVATKVWALQSQRVEKRGKAKALWVIAALVQIAAGLYAYAMSLWIAWVLMAVALVVAIVAQIASSRKMEKSGGEEDAIKVTIRVDEGKLFHALDVQMQAIDRHVNDFAYLNEQALGLHAVPDGKIVSLVADMLEALYESDEESGEAAKEAADRMLSGLGLAAAAYSSSNQALFTVLPSKAITRTMIPAIMAAADGRLLRRGVAAVQMDEAAG